MDSTVPSTTRTDVYRTITDKIVAAIEHGAEAFVMPWHRAGPGIVRPTNAATRAAYQGVNVVALWAEASLAGYGAGHWATYKQWAGLGAQVRRGERGSTIVFYKKLKATEATDDDEEPQGDRLIARASTVFNASQVDGWEAEFPMTTSLVERIEAADSFIAATGAEIREGGDVACYSHQQDHIRMPARERFVGTPTSSPTEAYYATLLHELTHWTGAAHRLDRTFGSRFGDHAYAMEELVAELGAAFLCSDLALANEPRPDHAAYLSHWLAVLKADSRAVFTAARLASQAATHLRFGEPTF